MSIRVNVNSSPGSARVSANTSPHSVSVETRGQQGPTGAPGQDGTSGFWVNIKDYGAVGDGVTNDSQAFADVTADYQGLPLQLYLPPGSYFLDWLDPAFPTSNPLQGIPNLVIWGYGASLVNPNDGDYVVFGGVDPFTNDDQNPYALISNAVPFDASLTLLNLADASKFSAGDWIIVSALPQQRDGQPINNPYLFEFLQIDSISGTTINLKSEVKGGPYLSTFPSLTSSEDGRYIGGPATIWKPNQAWNTEIDIRGLSFPGANGPNILGRKIRLIDCSFTNSNFVLPTTQYQYVAERCSFVPGVSIEVDKVIERLILRDCFIHGELLFQSAGGGALTSIQDCHIDTMTGTPRRISIRDSNIDNLGIGPRFTGNTESVIIENCDIRNIDYLDSYKNGLSGNLVSDWTMTNGTLSAPVTTVSHWAYPGSKVNSVKAGLNEWYNLPFVVTAVRTDGSNTLIDTTLPDPLPGLTSYRFIDHPCPNITARNSRGCLDINSLSVAPDGKPLWTYARKLFVSAADFTNATDMLINVRGKVVEIRINVIRAYTGVEVGLVFAPSSFIKVMDSSFSTSNSAFFIDCNTAGQRVLDQSGNTLLGADTSDSYADAWIIRRIEFIPPLSADITGETPDKWPIIDFEITTDQGVIGIPV